MAHATNTTDISALTPANDIVRNAIYIWKSATGEVFRVKIIECFDLAADIEHESAWRCNCFFIDIGKCATITCGKLYQLNDKFNRIAPQAICFRPYGFDELNNCPHINNLLTAWLLYRQFVACIMMTERQYYAQCDTTARTPKIDIALFKGHPQFTQLKPILFEQIGKSLPIAAINVSQPNVNVSYVCHSLVYVQTDHHCISHINTLIQLIVRKNQLMECPINRLQQANAIVLVYDKQRKIYVRAKILRIDNVVRNVCECFYIDYGDVSLVAATQIYELDELSFLNHLPSQAVPAKLNLLPNIDAVRVERLRGIFQRNSKVQIEIVDRLQHLPIVNLFKRMQQYRLHVNKLVQMEKELQECVQFFLSRFEIFMNHETVLKDFLSFFVGRLQHYLTTTFKTIDYTPYNAK